MAVTITGEEIYSPLALIKLPVAVVAFMVAFPGRRAPGNTTKYWAAVGGLTSLNPVLAAALGK